ncbi:hypothetical protein Q5H93_17325 [Hymenobacter sp. ASUV-10]|uniref:Uncharacterized protein n=1 Tax=Hymenobacter aranciens TaxID=3063996 RepID=A0ABT9BE36_9BACT|nr:hypothetical protein [Hymenobacter sp. ASUV-10]MDO7876509.1 hypothetical protein [Hymenobacter sp. ASUV-10]
MMVTVRNLTLLLLVYLPGACVSVPAKTGTDPRVAAYFQDYFAVLHREVDGTGDLAALKSKDYELLLINGDSLYMVARVGEALRFIQTISGIQAPIRNPGQYTAAPAPTRAVLRRWEQWYQANQHALRWDEITKQPVRK